jgi:gamma-glutamylcyclotransferase (GGCT)/AIG2-like uncharacterized protein YtfP
LNPRSDADTRLATYGTLGPGRPNHHQLADLAGSWRIGTVKGLLISDGWGAALGYPALVLDPLASPVEVSLFESPELPKHWSRLDEFEGDGYRRVLTDVEIGDERVRAWIYVSAAANE